MDKEDQLLQGPTWGAGSSLSFVAVLGSVPAGVWRTLPGCEDLGAGHLGLTMWP